MDVWLSSLLAQPLSLQHLADQDRNSISKTDACSIFAQDEVSFTLASGPCLVLAAINTAGLGQKARHFVFGQAFSSKALTRLTCRGGSARETPELLFHTAIALTMAKKGENEIITLVRVLEKGSKDKRDITIDDIISNPVSCGYLLDFCQKGVRLSCVCGWLIGLEELTRVALWLLVLRREPQLLHGRGQV